MEELDAVSLERCGLADGSAQNGSLPAMLTSDWLEEELDTLLWSSPATDVLQLYVEAEEEEEVHVVIITHTIRTSSSATRQTDGGTCAARQAALRQHAEPFLQIRRLLTEALLSRRRVGAEVCGSEQTQRGESRLHVCMAASLIVQRNIRNSSGNIQK